MWITKSVITKSKHWSLSWPHSFDFILDHCSPSSSYDHSQQQQHSPEIVLIDGSPRPPKHSQQLTLIGSKPQNQQQYHTKTIQFRPSKPEHFFISEQEHSEQVQQATSAFTKVRPKPNISFIFSNVHVPVISTPKQRTNHINWNRTKDNINSWPNPSIVSASNKHQHTYLFLARLCHQMMLHSIPCPQFFPLQYIHNNPVPYITTPCIQGQNITHLLTTYETTRHWPPHPKHSHNNNCHSANKSLQFQFTISLVIYEIISTTIINNIITTTLHHPHHRVFIILNSMGK